MLQPGDKKALGIIGGVVVAAIAIIAIATTVLVHGHEKPLPEISFQAGDDLTRAEPAFWCSVQMTDCRGVDDKGRIKVRTYDHPVPIGESAVLSVPKDVATGPWTLIATYATPRGLLAVQQLHLPDQRYTERIESTPKRVLLGIEVSSIAGRRIQLPGAQQAESDVFAVRGTYSIRTAPKDFTIRNRTELPDQMG